MKKILSYINLFCILIALAVIFTGCEFVQVEVESMTPETNIKNVIFFIGDGMGTEHVKAGELYKGEPLALQGMPWHSLMTTSSLSSGYTDSAAAATALATGTKVYNKSVGIGPDGEKLTSIIDLLSDRLVKTGFITTDFLDEATPAGYLSHAETRELKGVVLENMVHTKADLIIAKAPKQFETEYSQGFVDKGFELLTKTSELGYDHERTLVALSSIVARGSGATLEDLVCFALDYLDNNPNGFFLTVEGANIDKYSHLHELEAVLVELLAFDRAIDIALKWAEGRKDTVIFVTADHECGGLMIEEGATSENILDKAYFTSDNHTDAPVDFYAWGENLPALTDMIDITDVFQMCYDYYDRTNL